MSDDETQEEESSTELPPEQEDRIVDKVVSKVKDTLNDLFKGPGEPAKEAESETEEEVKEPTSIREIEDDMEAKVRAVMGDITAEEDHKKIHEQLKKEAERPPVQYSKVTRWFWVSEGK
jgi:hypothetical protein